ncbi:MAG: aconitase X catalytic domain-containing protein [Methanomassiliicoccales archaeon]|nr:aconitase X catalytic domain-containing protein [Methanomassiliicoccales archaeon]
MQLTPEETSMLAGKEGRGKQKAMELLAALGKIYRADRLIPITSAHLSGVSYKTIGEGGIDFLEEMAKDSKVCVPTTLNPMGMDTERWKEMGVSEHFAKRQLHIISLYEKMGVEINCTCTPYLLTNRPKVGDHIAWAESSALSFANSVLGARTNREGGPGALAAAITGRTPNYGLHLEQNRKATHVVQVEEGIGQDEWSIVGHTVGRKLGACVPFFRGLGHDVNGLKSLAAAMAASGSVAMFMVEGVTPEQPASLAGLPTLSVTRQDLEDTVKRLRTGTKPDLIAIGCPHLSEREMKELAAKLDGKVKKGDVEVWFCTSKGVWLRCPKERAVLERFGKVLCDTCMVVAPIEGLHKVTASDSAKACAYLPGLCSQKVFCGSQRELLEMIL